MTQPEDETDQAMAGLVDHTDVVQPHSYRDGAVRSLVAFRIGDRPHTIVPAPRSRRWMDKTNQRFAYRCLPLVIANQAGWWILNPQRFSVAWNGGNGTDAIVFDFFGEPPTHPATSHFGHGLITFEVPFIFRTPPGWNLLARGPSNLPKAGIAPLDGLVETDWSVATFTMNWQFTAVDQWATFERDEPYCMIVPQQRGVLEQFAPEIVPLTANHSLHAGYTAWRQSRGAFNMAIRFGDHAAARQGWQRHYMRGLTPAGQQALQHQTQLRLRPVRERTMSAMPHRPGKRARLMPPHRVRPPRG